MYSIVMNRSSKFVEPMSQLLNIRSPKFLVSIAHSYGYIMQGRSDDQKLRYSFNKIPLDIFADTPCMFAAGNSECVDT